MLQARFIGENGSRGFATGKVYNFTTKIDRGILWVSDSDGRMCGYSNMEALLDNWSFDLDKETEPLATYEMRATGKDSTGYYYTDWKRATPIKVRATSKKEAIKKAEQALGTPPRLSDMWAITVDSIVVD